MTATIPDTILNIDLADGHFYADRTTSREAYRWMRGNQPVFRSSGRTTWFPG